MKLVLIISLLLATNCGKADDSIAICQQNASKYLFDSSENMVSTGYGWAGLTTKNLYCLRELIHGNRIDLITQMLDSEIAATRFLAAHTLNIYERKFHWKADSVTNKKRQEVKWSNDRVYTVNGCIGGFSYTIASLFDVQKKSLLYKSTNTWILNSFK